jgi:hypothetical protein
MKTKTTKKENTKKVLAISTITELIKYCKSIGLENWRDIFRNTFKYSHNHLNDIELQLWRLQGQRWQRCNKVDKLLIYKKIHNNIKELKHNYTNYSKVLTIGNTNIYMCHPYYGHRDYNKSILCPINSIDSKIIALTQQIENKIINK